MSVNSQIGASAAVLVDGYDLSRYLKSVRMTSMLQAIDDTRFRSTNYAREFVAGLRGGAVGMTGSLPTDEDGTIPDPNGTWANPRSAHDIFVAPNGAAPGNLARMGKSLQSAYSAGADAADAINGFTADWEKTSGSPGVLPGISLWTPHGSASITAGTNEVQTLARSGLVTGGTFTLTYDGQTTAAIAWNASSATIQAALEALSNMAPGDVVVSNNAGNPVNVGPQVITFGGTLEGTNVVLITADSTSLVGGGTYDVTLTTEGAAGTSIGNLNVATATANGTACRDIALSATTNKGAVLQINAIATSLGTRSLTVLVEHAPNSGGSPGAWATLGTFSALTGTGSQVVQVASAANAGPTINPFVRARISAITGSWAFAVGFARRYG